MNWFYNLKISTKLLISFSIVALLAAIIGYFGISGLSSLSSDIETSYTKMTVPISTMGKLSSNFERVRMHTRDIIFADSESSLNEYIEAVNELNDKIDKQSSEFEQSIQSDTVKAAFEQFIQTKDVYRQQLDRLINLAKAKREVDAYLLLYGEMGMASQNHEEAVNNLIALKVRNSEISYQEGSGMASSYIIIMIILALIGVLSAVGLGIFISRRIGLPVRNLAAVANNIAAGNLNMHLDSQYSDEIGALEKSFISVVDTLKNLVAETSKLTKEAVKGNFETRGDESQFDGSYKEIVVGVNETLDVVVEKTFWYEQVLDAVPFPVSVTDMDMNWTFINKPVQDIIGKTRDDIKLGETPCKEWNANICGTDKCGVALLRQGITRSEFKQPGLDKEFQVDSAYILNRDGEKIGHIEVVQDVTDMNNAKREALAAKEEADKASAIANKRSEYQQKEVVKLAENLKNVAIGDLNINTKVADADEDTKEARENFVLINNNLSALVDAMKNITNVAEKISQGDLKVSITKRSDNDQLMAALQNMVKSLDSIVMLMGDYIQHVETGEIKSLNISSAGYDGVYRTLVDGLIKSRDTISAPLTEVTDVLIAISKGDLSKKMQGQYQGIWNSLSESSATVVENLNEFISAMEKMYKEQAAGDIDSLLNTERFSGAYGKMAEGVNNAVNLHVDNLMMILEIVQAYAGGDFSKELKKLPGKQAIANERLDLLKANLVSVINETKKMYDAQKVGDTDYVIKAESFDGDWKEMVGGINNLVKYQIDYAAEIFDVLTAYSGGNFGKVLRQMPGKQAIANETLNTLQATLKDMTQEVINLTGAALNGQLDVRANADKYKGMYKELISGINNTMDAVIRPLNTSADYVEKISLGDLPEQIREEYKGDFNDIKQSINRLIGAMQDITNTANQIADGDMTVKINLRSDNDKLMIAMNNMVEKVGETLNQVTNVANAVASGSSQLSSSAETMSQGATEQAASLQEVSSSMNEISSQTKNNAENAAQANNLANASKNSAEQGNFQMQNLMRAMNEINESSKNISKIMKVIDEIAFQTNLLALNAAVEAARAGRHGKGFAVVAEEVRNLAARSAKAAKETAEMIENAIKRSENGFEIVNTTAEILQEVKDGATKTADILAEIAAASNEQADGISQINNGLMQVDKVTQQNTSYAEQSASAAQELADQSNRLKQLLLQFTLKSSDGQKRIGTFKSEKRKLVEPKGVKMISPQDVIKLDDEEFGKY